MKHKPLILNSLLVLLSFFFFGYSISELPDSQLRSSSKGDLISLVSEQEKIPLSFTSDSQVYLSEQLNAKFQSLSIPQADELGLIGGAKLISLSEGILQEQSSIKEGFVITKVNGKKIYSAEHLFTELAKLESSLILEGIYDDLAQVHDDLPGTFSYEIILSRQM
ncbi:MAG: hypothetical protein AAFY45_09355 [Bacteroidota bacterium]